MMPKIRCAVILSLLAAALPAAAQPQLQIRAIYLDESHEEGGFLGNDPEIELFEARSTSPFFNVFQGNNRASILFNGRPNIGIPYTGKAPDADDTGKWYTLNPPYVLSAPQGTAVLLVEDDDLASYWSGSSSFLNGFTCTPVVNGSLPAAISVCQNPKFSGSDDIFRNMLVVTGAAALGMSETIVDLGEWRIKVAIGN